MPGFVDESQRTNLFGILNQFGNRARLRQFDWKKDVQSNRSEVNVSEVEKFVILGQREFASNLIQLLANCFRKVAYN